MEENQDTITVGTAATGGAVKVHFDYGKEAKEDIETKADFAAKLATKLKKFKEQYGG